MSTRLMSALSAALHWLRARTWRMALALLAAVLVIAAAMVAWLWLSKPVYVRWNVRALSAAWSPRGDELAVLYSDDTIDILAQHGARLVFSRRLKVPVPAPPGHTPPPLRESTTSGLAWSPDGTLLAESGYYRETLLVWRVKDGSVVSGRVTIRPLPKNPHIGLNVWGGTADWKWSPDSRSIAFASGNPDAPESDPESRTRTWLKLWQPESGLDQSPPSSTASPDAAAAAPAPAPGQAAQPPEMKDSLGRLAWGPDTTEEGLGELAWSPDGTMIIGVCGSHFRLFLLQPDGTWRSQKLSGGENLHGVAWSPDGTRIAGYADRTDVRFGTCSLQIWSIDKAGGTATLQQSADITDFGIFPKCPEVVWSPDGKRVTMVYLTLITEIPSLFAPSQIIEMKLVDMDAATGAFGATLTVPFMHEWGRAWTSEHRLYVAYPNVRILSPSATHVALGMLYGIYNPYNGKSWLKFSTISLHSRSGSLPQKQRSSSSPGR
ncbi:MAG TPA: hypothetical protein VK970_10325 [Candidatus Methylacidiphilales bacterium]|nr:hypothetical protein [Candidatus Methylacidiphilales bacterium]